MLACRCNPRPGRSPDVGLPDQGVLPGTQRLMGVEPSHACVALHMPFHGWVESDPINDPLAESRCITLP
jgi:hypothetical protein